MPWRASGGGWRGPAKRHARILAQGLQLRLRMQAQKEMAFPFSSWRRRAPLGRALDHVVIAARLARAAADTSIPVVVNLIVTRRCNLSCGYCHEFDKSSPPVPLAVLAERIDQLASLGTIFVTLTGGETLLHPQIAEVVAHVRARGMVPLLNTNGYLLTRAHIDALNAAGLFGMQISVDNVTPNHMTQKSLKPLLPKLRLLARHAAFRVRVGTVLGAGAPEDAIEVARAALDLGLETKCQLARDAAGALIPVDDVSRLAYAELASLGRRSTRWLSEDFQTELLAKGQVAWKCRAGARYFHVNEDDLVQYCPAHAATPGIPLARYGTRDLAHAFDAVKPCAATCTQPYAHQVSRLDAWRGQGAPAATHPMRAPTDVKRRLPVV